MTWIVAGFREAREADRRERIWHTWHIAALQRAQKLPPLAKMITDTNKPEKRRQTAQEIFAIMEMWRRKIDRQNERVKR